MSWAQFHESDDEVGAVGVATHPLADSTAPATPIPVAAAAASPRTRSRSRSPMHVSSGSQGPSLSVASSAPTALKVPVFRLGAEWWQVPLHEAAMHSPGKHVFEKTPLRPMTHESGCCGLIMEKFAPQATSTQHTKSLRRWVLVLNDMGPILTVFWLLPSILLLPSPFLATSPLSF